MSVDVVRWLGPLLATGCVLLAGVSVRMLTVPVVGVVSPVAASVDSDAQSITDRLFERVGRGLVRFAALGDGGSVGRRIAAAGGLDGLTPTRFFARRGGGVVIGLLVGALLIWSGYRFIGAFAALTIALQADYRLRSAARQRQDEIERLLPDLLDILSITLLAGTSFRAGLTRVAQSMPGVLSDELRTLNQQMDVGVSRRQAFAQLRDRNPSPSIRRLVGGVLQAEELGHSLSDTLTDLATQMRSTGARTARKRADSTDKTISLLTATLLLPALVLLVIAIFLGGLRVG
jgi:tight adherence protein C